MSSATVTADPCWAGTRSPDWTSTLSVARVREASDLDPLMVRVTRRRRPWLSAPGVDRDLPLVVADSLDRAAAAFCPGGRTRCRLAAPVGDEGQVSATDAERFVGARLYPVVGWDLAVLEFPGHLDGRPELSGDPDLASPSVGSRAEPQVVLAGPVDLCLESLPHARHSAQSNKQSKTPEVPNRSC